MTGPTMAKALNATNDPNVSSLDIQAEATLEQQREKEYDDSKSDLKQPEYVSEEMSNGLPHIMDGLGWDEPTSNSEDFLYDGKLQKEVMDTFENHNNVNIIIRLKEQANMNEVYQRGVQNKSRVERIEHVRDHLQQVAQKAQSHVLRDLEQLERMKLASNIRTFWVFNGMAATVSKEALERLLERDDIERITIDKVLTLPDTTVDSTPPQLPEWGLEKINAPMVWGEYGIKGEGIVVGIMDTGVDGNHEALKHNYRGRDGNHQFSWVDLSGNNYSSPNDGNGHGTHVAGTAVGGGVGKPIGVAPEAEWIAAKIFNDNGGTTTSAIHAAFEWFLAPGGDPEKAPHVVNNSWGSAETYRTEFRDGVQAWVAAGIFPLFAAGNSGPGSQTIGSPASYPISFSIGATDSNDQIAYFSSRGPVFWTDEEGHLIRYVKPEVSAPGHQIYSAWPAAKNEGEYATISGTSMATPHVAGAIALILQANPNLSIHEVADLLEQTARAEAFMGEIPNDVYGHGIVNVYQAVTEAAFAGQIKGQLTNEQGQPISGEIHIPDQKLKIMISGDGQFDFKLREGTHRVIVSSFGYDSVEESILVEKGQVKQVQWTLSETERYTVNGSVSFTSSLNKVPYAFIRLIDTPLGTVRSNGAGEFSISQVPQGKYQLSITGQGIQRQVVEIEVNQDLALDLVVSEWHVQAELDWTTLNNNNQRNAVTNEVIDHESLERAWYYKANGQLLFNTPAVANGTIVFTTDTGWIVALDERSGEEKWLVRTASSNRSSPTIANGTVYVAGGNDGSISAIDLETGITNWTFNAGVPAIYEAPLYLDGILYLSTGWDSQAKVTALEANSGTKLWSQEIGELSAFGASIGGGKLYVGTYDNRTLSALSLDGGATDWSLQLETEGFVSQPVYSDGQLFVVSSHLSRGTGTLRAIDAATGNIIWSVDGIGDTQAGSAIVFDHLVIMGSATNSMLRAFHRETGEELWVNTEVGTMLNNGAVAANGLLFVADTFGKLFALDVYTGEKLRDFTLNDMMTSGIAITAGKVVVPDRQGISSFVAPGVLMGSIQDSTGNAVQGKITILETGTSTMANEDGSFLLREQPGEYTLKIAKYGLLQKTEQVSFVSGLVLEKEYRLVEASSGSIAGTVTDKRTGLPMQNVQVRVLDTPLESTTNEEGLFSFESIYEGSYDVELSLGGYVTEIVPVTIVAGTETDVLIGLVPIDVAVLNDWEGEISRFLVANGISAEERDWDVVDDLARYEVLYLNGAYTSGGWKPNKDTLDHLLQSAKEAGVSVVFADTWGMSYGSIWQLNEFYQDPRELGSDYYNAKITLQIDQEHPILAGFNAGQRVDLYERSGEFSWFNQYTGRELATIGSSRLGFVGAGVAYKGVSEDSAHLLLSSHAASPWISPYNGWLQPQQQILVNGIQFLMEAEFGQLSGIVVDTAGDPVEAQIEVLETGVSAQSDLEAGLFTLFHDEGKYEVQIRARGYATQVIDIDFQRGIPVELNVELVSSSGGITGQVLHKLTNQQLTGAGIVVYDEDGKIAAETVTASNGRYEVTGLDEAVYSIEITNEGFIAQTREVIVSGATPEQDFYLYPTPKVAILGDYFSSTANLRFLLGSEGIEAENFTTIAALTQRMNEFDVVYYNDMASGVNEVTLNEFLNAADQFEVSIIFGDTYWSGSGANQLVLHRGDPETRTTLRNVSSSAGYVVIEEHPIFGSAVAEEFVNILLPSNSSIAYYYNYSGFPLANIKHESSAEAYGVGVAYKPRTGNSLELVMGGHGFSFTHHAGHYTDKGKQLFIDAILWAAYTEFSTIQGQVVDRNGAPLFAKIEVLETGLSTWTNPETGEFSLAHLDGEYEIEITSFAYESQRMSLSVDRNLENISIEMNVSEEAGSFMGFVVNEQTGTPLADAHIEVVGFPRETLTNGSGEYRIEHLMPGTYSLVIQREGYLVREFEVEIIAGQITTLDIPLKPTLTIGIIVDAFASSQVPLATYLKEKGYQAVELTFTDTERLEEVDLVFVNSAYDNSRIPEKDQFISFLKEIDRTETPIIWTGQHGGQGSIRYLWEYIEDPSVIHAGSTPFSDRLLTAHLVENHPILEGINASEFDFDSRYYYGFDNYSGSTVANLSHSSLGDLGSMIAYKGRTMKSVEVLLSTMTIGNEFHADHANFDPDRERILNNAILWAIENDEPLVGELHGQIANDLDQSVQAKITVIETGYTMDTERDGSFFLALDTGQYTLQVEAFGHATQSFVIDMERGVRTYAPFTVISDQSGMIKGEVKAAGTGAGIPGAYVQLVGTPLDTYTDEAGNYQMIVPVGEYQLRVTAAGYTPAVYPVNVMNEEETVINASLAISEKIAVSGTSLNADRIVSFLNGNGYEAVTWINSNFAQLMEELDEYALVVINDRHYSTNQAMFNQFLDLADEAEVSIIFTSQYSGGSIKDLSDFTGDPQNVSWTFAPSSINYQVTQAHPIFTGYQVGDVLKILNNGTSNQQYAIYGNYSGQTIASVTHNDRGVLGEGVGFSFRGANNVHILLSSLRAGSYGHPELRWTDDAKQIFINSVDWALSASLGEIKGHVTDEDGNPIMGATVTIKSEGLSAMTNSTGFYRLGVGLGEYEVTVRAQGYLEQSETVSVLSLGEVVELNFTLESKERMKLSGTVIEAGTNKELEGATLTLKGMTEELEDFEEFRFTDHEGNYLFEGLISGEYELTVTADRYQTVTRQVIIEAGEDVQLNISLGTFGVAVIGDLEDRLSSFLNENGLSAETRGWDVLDDIQRYELIIINSNKGTMEEVNQLITESDQHQVSLVFLDTWGIKDGSIHLLESVQGHPQLSMQGYNEGSVNLQREKEHVIFDGMSETELIHIHSEASPYSTFVNYTGSTLASLVVDGENKGASIAYEFRSQQHLHLLLSSYAVSNIIGPEYGWTEDGKRLFLQALRWAQTAEQELPGLPQWDEYDLRTQDSLMTVTGSVYGGESTGVYVDIYKREGNKENIVATVLVDEEGRYSVELEVERGSNKFKAAARNYAGTIFDDKELNIVSTPATGPPEDKGPPEKSPGNKQ
jgi:outer membrane protein assembly factor BamB